MSLLSGFENPPRTTRAYWVFLVLGNALFFLFSYPLRNEIFSHYDIFMFFWIIPLVLAVGPAACLFISEFLPKKFWLICIFSLFFWSRAYFEIADMEPCFAGQRPTIAFWMLPYYSEPP